MWPGISASQYAFAFEFPHSLTCSIQCEFHSSKLVDLTFEMCVPMRRCTAEQGTQMKMPRLIEAQRGDLVLQSAHTSLPALARSFLIAFLFFA